MSLRRIALTFAFVLVSSVAVGAPQALQVADNQVRMAVMGQDDFHPDRAAPGNVRSLPDGLAARLIEHLSATQRFSIVERAALRRVVREQQFGKQRTATDLDRVIEKTVENLPATSGWTIAAAATAADHNDVLKEFQDLGTTVGADYIVYAVLEKHRFSTESSAVPFSDRGRSMTSNRIDARLRLRVIETRLGRVIGADSIRAQVSEAVFTGREASNDEYAMFDHLGQEAALRVLDIVFPARIVDQDPWVINRGSNERVAVGDRFRVVREGKEIKDDSGIVIGRLKSQIGSAQVAQVQETIAVLTPVSGEFAVNDLAVQERDDATTAAPATSAPPVAPGAASAAGGSGERPRLAVGLVKAYSTATTGTDANLHIPAFTDTLISRLAQTRRFQLIDRQEVDQLLDEQLAQAMAENRDLPSAVGTLAGADYLVIGSIANFAIERLTSKLPGSNRILVTHQGRVEGNMRIVDARSGEVLDSRKVSIKEELAEPASANQVVSALADAYADQTVVNLMNAVFPIKVAAVVSGVAYINRGSDGGLSVGEVLNVVRPGQPIIDPDTGVQLGVAETELGRVTLAEVEDARSKAPVGDLSLQTGDILKRQPAARGQRSGSVATAAPRRSGGDAERPDGTPLTLAVGKIRINERGRNHAVRGANITRVTNDLMVKLSQFPEFDVMERAEIDQIIDEKALTSIAQGGSLPGAMRELEGADYLVIAQIDEFLIRTERKQVPYTDEIQTRYFGTVESTLRLVDVHTGKLAAADKIRLSERVRDVPDAALAAADLLDLYTSELVHRISDTLVARQRGEDTRPDRPLADVPPARPQPRPVKRPNF
ncbi:MAG: hypothetical protein H6955_08100 [Chromatiaceae bacterium]|nr:hypothetical protein [Chromatiaceae bacterium]